MFIGEQERITDLSRVFLEPQSTIHRQYEALRAYFVDKVASAEAARRFGYTPGSFRVLVHQFRQNPRRAFFAATPKGPTHAPNKDKVRQQVIDLRKQNLSIDDISQVLREQGHTLSPVSVWLILQEEGFARLAEQEHADLILLQEVARTQVLRVDEWLGERLCMASVYSRANGHRAIGFEEGLAVLSRFPLDRVCIHQFASRLNPFVRRLALGAAVETPCGRLLAFSVHLGLLRRENAAQVRSLVDWITRTAAGRTALVGGDFNAHETTRQIAHARQRWLDTFRYLHPHADGTTHTLRWLRGRIAHRHRLDYIFLHSGNQSWEVRETCHLDAPGGPHSDHRAVLTRLVFLT